MTNTAKQVEHLSDRLLTLKRYMRDHYYKLPVIALMSKMSIRTFMDKTYYHVDLKLRHYQALKTALSIRTNN